MNICNLKNPPHTDLFCRKNDCLGSVTITHPDRGLLGPCKIIWLHSIKPKWKWNTLNYWNNHDDIVKLHFFSQVTSFPNSKKVLLPILWSMWSLHIPLMVTSGDLVRVYSRLSPDDCQDSFQPPPSVSLMWKGGQLIDNVWKYPEICH